MLNVRKHYECALQTLWPSPGLTTALYCCPAEQVRESQREIRKGVRGADNAWLTAGAERWLAHKSCYETGTWAPGWLSKPCLLHRCCDIQCHYCHHFSRIAAYWGASLVDMLLQALAMLGALPPCFALDKPPHRNAVLCAAEIEREIFQAKREEDKLIREIKLAAKQGNAGSARILAKSLIRLRAHITKLQTSAANLKARACALCRRLCVPSTAFLIAPVPFAITCLNVHSAVIRKCSCVNTPSS